MERPLASRVISALGEAARTARILRGIQSRARKMARWVLCLGRLWRFVMV
jgi:hypothetical protein